MINKVILLGNITADPEIRTTPTGNECCRFSVALNGRNAKGERTVEYVNCSAWDDTGRSIARYCRRGDSVAVVGALKFSKYKTKHGDTATACTVNVYEWSFGGGSGRKDNGADETAEPEVSLPAGEDDLPF